MHKMKKDESLYKSWASIELNELSAPITILLLLVQKLVREQCLSNFIRSFRAEIIYNHVFTYILFISMALDMVGESAERPTNHCGSKVLLFISFCVRKNYSTNESHSNENHQYNRIGERTQHTSRAYVALIVVVIIIVMHISPNCNVTHTTEHFGMSEIHWHFTQLNRISPSVIIIIIIIVMSSNGARATGWRKTLFTFSPFSIHSSAVRAAITTML